MSNILGKLWHKGTLTKLCNNESVAPSKVRAAFLAFGAEETPTEARGPKFSYIYHVPTGKGVSGSAEAIRRSGERRLIVQFAKTTLDQADINITPNRRSLYASCKAMAKQMLGKS